MQNEIDYESDISFYASNGDKVYRLDNILVYTKKTLVYQEL